jgi:hypothetical protein
VTVRAKIITCFLFGQHWLLTERSRAKWQRHRRQVGVVVAIVAENST